jgi:hypothetical protein
MRTSELQGAALDWAVAKCEGVFVQISNGGWWVFDSDAFSEFRNDYNDSKLQAFQPSTDWSQGGPIIEREGIHIKKHPSDWIALPYDSVFSEEAYQQGPTPLVSAMRCYVASKMGDEVEVPDELLQGE